MHEHELALTTTFSGDLVEHPQRPGFYQVRCACGFVGGVSDPEALAELPRAPRPTITVAGPGNLNRSFAARERERSRREETAIAREVL